MIDPYSPSPFEIIATHQKRPPVDVDTIARGLGLNVERRSLGEHISGQIIRDERKGGRSGFVIIVNSDDHIRRQRFTLAHEIGHYVLHRDLIEDGVTDDTLYRSAELTGYQETQANRFAADLLMPLSLVRAMWVQQKDVLALARLFQVSPTAMEIGLKAFDAGIPGAELRALGGRLASLHLSDCAVHNAPAYEPGECDCGAVKADSCGLMRQP